MTEKFLSFYLRMLTKFVVISAILLAFAGLFGYPVFIGFSKAYCEVLNSTFFPEFCSKAVSAMYYQNQIILHNALIVSVCAIVLGALQFVGDGKAGLKALHSLKPYLFALGFSAVFAEFVLPDLALRIVQGFQLLYVGTGVPPGLGLFASVVMFLPILVSLALAIGILALGILKQETLKILEA